MFTRVLLILHIFVLYFRILQEDRSTLGLNVLLLRVSKNVMTFFGHVRLSK